MAFTTKSSGEDRLEKTRLTGDALKLYSEAKNECNKLLDKIDSPTFYEKLDELYAKAEKKSDQLEHRDAAKYYLAYALVCKGMYNQGKKPNGHIGSRKYYIHSLKSAAEQASYMDIESKSGSNVSLNYLTQYLEKTAYSETLKVIDSLEKNLSSTNYRKSFEYLTIAKLHMYCWQYLCYSQKLKNAHELLASENFKKAADALKGSTGFDSLRREIYLLIAKNPFSYFDIIHVGRGLQFNDITDINF